MYYEYKDISMNTKVKIQDIIKNQLDEVTDFDVSTITDDTLVSDFGLESLDFISIQVALKRAFGITVDLNLLSESNVVTFNDLVNFLDEIINQSGK